jgi:hypothetical protein
MPKSCNQARKPKKRAVDHHCRSQIPDNRKADADRQRPSPIYVHTRYCERNGCDGHSQHFKPSEIDGSRLTQA